MSIDYRIGDTRDVIATIPDNSVSLVACSPPFVALRSYLPADHPDKHREIGSEPDPATFLDTLLALTAEWFRVLAPWGSIAIELGDTYAASPGQHGPDADGALNRSGQQKGERDRIARQAAGGGRGWPLPKCLALVPQAYALSLAYGRNVLNGNPSPAGQALVRNMIVWHRPNPAVGALGDKFRPSTSYITVATKSPKRWFDLTAVRTTPTIDPGRMMPGSPSHGKAREAAGLSPFGTGTGGNPAGAPPLDAWFDHHDTWTLTTQPSSLAHYAMWPARLAERLVLSMCPLEVCDTCGEPRRRIEGKAEYVNPRSGGEPTTLHFRNGQHIPGAGNNVDSSGMGDRAAVRVAPTLGWTDCGHADYRPGVVLDPFAGTGTTLAVAECHGRDSIGIDIDARNRDLLPARMDEVRKHLFGVKPQVPGQMEMFA